MSIPCTSLKSTCPPLVSILVSVNPFVWEGWEDNSRSEEIVAWNSRRVTECVISLQFFMKTQWEDGKGSVIECLLSGDSQAVDSFASKQFELDKGS